MKVRTFTCLALLAAASAAQAQGTLQYDQQSSSGPIPPNILDNIQGNGPLGQSFTPGFVQLNCSMAIPATDWARRFT